MATAPVLANSAKPKSFINEIKASNFSEDPVNSKIKYCFVLSTTFALKMSAVLKASNLFSPLHFTLTNISSLETNGPSEVKSTTL